MSASSAVSGSEAGTVSREVAVAVARKSLDAQKEQGAAMVEMLDSAGRIARANAENAPAGARVDVYG